MSVEVRAYLESQLAGVRNLRTFYQGEISNLNRQETMLLGLLEQVPAPVPPVHTPQPYDGERLPEGTTWNEEGQYYELPDGTRVAEKGWT